jgi:hypothetical protein
VRQRLSQLLVLLFLVLAINVGRIEAQTVSDPPTIDELFEYKEVFTFEVKYGFLRLGEVEVTMMPDSMFRGQLHKHLVTKIVSNPKIPFIGTEIDHFNSLFTVDENGLPVTSYYWKDNIDEDIYKDIEYDFDREKMYVTYKEEDQSRDTLELEEPATAGHVIFLFSRLFAGTDVENSMIVYVTKRKGYIHFENGTELERRNYKPWDEPVNAFLTTGYTENIDGPFGFSGKFRAWFLDDELRVPLEARVKVLFGNALVRLIDYKKVAL